MKGQARSIRRTIQMACIGLILITLVVNALGLMAYNDAINNNTHHTFEALAASMGAQVGIAMDSLSESVKSAIYATQVQQVLFSQIPTDYLSNINAAEQIIRLVEDGNAYAGQLYMLAKGGRHAYISSDARDVCRPVLEGIMKEDAWPDGPVYTTIANDAANTDPTYLMCIVPVMDIRPGQFSSSPKGLGAIACSLTHILGILQGSANSDSTVVLVENSRILAAARDLTAEESALILGGEGASGQYLVHHIQHGDLPWSFAFLTQRQALEGNAPVLRNISFALLLIELVALLVLFVQVLASFLRPLRRLVSDVGAIERTQYSRVRVPDTQEFAILADAINDMLDEIERAAESERAARETLYAVQDEQTQAKLYAYRSQVNPHFLFNALECIRALAQQHAVPDIEAQVQSLSRSYRYLLDADMVVRLGDELRHVTGYFNLLKPQLARPPVLCIRALPQTLDTAILSLTLQPLIENALMHGIMPSGRDGVIDIHATAPSSPSDNLLIHVTDNGVGIDRETLAGLSRTLESDAALSQGEHIGLRNVARRLHLFFGEGYGLSLASVQGRYTRVTLRLPYRAAKEEIR